MRPPPIQVRDQEALQCQAGVHLGEHVAWLARLDVDTQAGAHANKNRDIGLF